MPAYTKKKIGQRYISFSMENPNIILHDLRATFDGEPTTIGEAAIGIAHDYLNMLMNVLLSIYKNEEAIPNLRNRIGNCKKFLKQVASECADDTRELTGPYDAELNGDKLTFRTQDSTSVISIKIQDRELLELHSKLVFGLRKQAMEKLTETKKKEKDKETDDL